MTTRALITGAGGFVGTYLAEGLAAAGVEVTGFDRSFDPAARARLGAVRLVEGALTKAALHGLGTFDLVIHGAAITTPPAAFGLSDVGFIKANCDLLFDCLDFAVACGARDFVFISSSGVFEAEDAEGVLLETTPASATSPYAVAKRAGEVVTDAANDRGLRAIAIRLGPIYGPGETVRDTRVSMSPIRRWIDAGSGGQPIVVELPDASRDWTYGPDLPGALLALLGQQPPLSGVFHLTSGEAIDDLSLAQRIAAHFGVECTIPRQAGPTRVPMSSCRIAPEALHHWTPLSTGLAKLLEQEAGR
jgi:UDP-glucose 4-epimerase